jgi:hypothetical protein
MEVEKMQGSINFDGSLVGNITGGGGGGGDTVVITPLVTSGTKIADVSVNGVEKDLYCPTPATPQEVEITPIMTSGTKIADVSVGGVEKDLYSPDYGADIAALDDRLDTTEDNITNLSGRMTEAENDISEINSALSNEEITSSDGRITFTRQGKHRLVQFNRAERSVITTFFNNLLATDCPKTFAMGAIVMTDSNIDPARYYRLAYAYIEGTTRPDIAILYNNQYNTDVGEEIATEATERFMGQVEWYTA